MVVTTIQKKLTTNRVIGGNKKQYLVIHDVGVKGQTAKNNVDYFHREKVSASCHYFVDRTSIWQSVEDKDTAWHVGDGKGKYGVLNSNSLGIEMIVEKDGTIHPETKANTKWLVNELIKKYNIPKSKVIRHYDASRKNCPQFLNKDGKWTEWKEFYSYLFTEDKKEDPKKTKEVEIKNMEKVSFDTLRKEAIKEIKAAVADGRFSSKHENVEDYSNETLQNYMLIALSRRK